MPVIEIRQHFVHDPHLGIAQALSLFLHIGKADGVTESLGADHLYGTGTLQALHGLGGHAQFSGDPLIGNGFLIHQLLQKALLGHLSPAPAFSQQRDDLLSPHDPLQRPVL